MRATLDTNVLVSAMATPHGIPVDIYHAWRENYFDLVISPYILNELQRVLIEKIQFPPTGVRETTDLLARLAMLVEPMVVWDARVPFNDLPIVGTALAGSVSYLVTGDRALLALKIFRHIPIVSPRRFLDTLRILS